MNRINKSLLAVAISSALAPLSTTAFSSELDLVLEEIVVTAQKRAQSVQDVPIAISAVSEELLEQTGVSTITDVIPMVPGVTGSDYGLATNTWAIRGISSNDWSIGSEPAVGVFFDDAYIGRNILSTGAFFDINRIEVVKGPQGTLFGRNAAAGAISVISNKPTDENELRLGIGLGNEGQKNYELVGNLAVSDTLAVRLAYQKEEWEGMWKEVNSGDDAYQESQTARFMALWSPSDDFEALLRLNYSEAETNYTSALNTQFNTADPGEEYPDKYSLSKPNYEENETKGVGLRLSWDINDSLTLVSISDYREGTNDYFEDVDGTGDDAAVDALLGAIGFGIAGATTLDVSIDTEVESVYQEFRLSGGSDEFSWFAGVSYYNEKVDLPTFDVFFVDTAVPLGPVAGLLVRNEGDYTSYGVYADATWQVTDQLALIGGLRWSEDDKDWCTNTLQDDLSVGPTAGEICTNETWSEVTPRLVAQYDLTNEMMVFASVAKGYKGGGFNNAASDRNLDGTAETIVPFDPETSIAYELGLKSTLLDGRMQFNASVFYSEYDDFQIQAATLTDGVVISNAGEAETQGLEMEVTYMAAENLLLMANYAYLDAEIAEGDIKGNELAYAPEHTYAVGANYEHSFLNGTLSWFGLYTYTDDFYHDAANVMKEDGYGLLSGKITYTPEGDKWDIAIAADNITDEEYASVRLDTADVVPGLGDNLNWGLKRMVRAEFNIYF
jgi:iron complex outermembrane recepter protein